MMNVFIHKWSQKISCRHNNNLIARNQFETYYSCKLTNSIHISTEWLIGLKNQKQNKLVQVDSIVSWMTQTFRDI